MGPGTGTARAPLRPLRRRLQRVCAVESGGRARADIAGTLAGSAPPAARESGQEQRRATMEPQIPWLQCDVGRAARLRVAPAAVQRLKPKLRGVLFRGRGRCLADTVQALNLATRGWVAYFRMAEVTQAFEDLDKWLRRKLRCIIWRQWKRPRTRIRELHRAGLDIARARASALNGRGPWWNAGASHMHAAVPTAALRSLGLLSLLAEYQRLQRVS